MNVSIINPLKKGKLEKIDFREPIAVVISLAQVQMR